MSTLLGMTALSLVMTSHASAEPTTLVRFDIPAEDLGAALTDVARQSNREIYFSSEVTRGKRSSGAHGDLTVETALQQLLAGSGLSFRMTPSGAISVGREVGNGSSNADDVPPSSAIVVTGTKIRGARIAAPTITIGREDIEKAGYATVERLFDDLPQNLREINSDAGLATGVSRLASSNSQGAAGISLRGLGAESTLVLLNGERRPGNIDGKVFDISAIPLAIVERVEIVTGGRSAIYGSDAVAGVVNLVTRRSFKGAESQIYLGTRTNGGGGQRVELTQIVGSDGDRAGFVLAYDFARDRPLKLEQTNLALPSPLGLVADTIGLQPDSTRHAIFGSGHAKMGGSVELYADLLYTHDRNRNLLKYNIPGIFSYAEADDIKSEQYSGVAGAKIELGHAWQADLSATHGAVRNVEGYEIDGTPGGSRTRALLTGASAVFQGPLFSLGTGRIRTAIGVAHRSEGLREASLTTGLTGTDDNRKINSAFGEIVVPLVASGPPGLRVLELSGAGRYDHYDDFGGTFNPQAGLIWKPLNALTLRGAWSSAFRAPSLIDLSLGNQAFLINMPDPKAGGANRPVLIWFGGNRDLKPETAKTWSLGFDYTPAFARGFKVSASYFNIAYSGRIDEPSSERTTALQDEALLGNLINRAPSSEYVTSILEGALATGGSLPFLNTTGVPFDPRTQNLLTVFPTLAVFDNRRNNVGVDKVDGLDFQVSASVPSGRSMFSFGSNATLYLHSTRKTTPTSPASKELNHQGKPVNFRARLNAGWERGPVGVFGYLNYTNHYKDTVADPPAPIGAWTTFDLALRFDGSKLVNPGPFRGTSLSFTVDNLFNSRAPVFRNNIFGFGYDPANASPVGRYVAARLAKRW